MRGKQRSFLTCESHPASFLPLLLKHLIAQTVTNITEALGEETRTSMILSAQVASLMSTVTAQNAAYVNMLNETQSMAIAELDNEIVSLTSNANEQAADISSAVENMTADAAAAQSTAVVQMATLANSLSRSVSTQMAAGTATIAAVNRTASASLVGKMNTRKHHWTGGCSGHRNGGWNWCKCRNITGCVPAALEGRRAAR